MKKLEGNFKRRPKTLKVIKLRWMIFILAPIRNRTLGHNKIEDALGPKEYVVVERVDPDRYVYRLEPKDGSVDMYYEPYQLQS